MVDELSFPHCDSDREVLARVANLLDGLGPFVPGTPRENKWRTTEQLAHALVERFGQEVDLDHLETLLRSHERQAKARLRHEQPPDALVRRATYPDRTTALTLWGSTKHHGQPWLGQAEPERLDPPDDSSMELQLDESAPRVFMSHAGQDAVVARQLAQDLAVLGIGTWMFETHIGYRRNIATCVREAIAATAGCTALVTRHSVASLWVLTELHTAHECGKPIWLIVDGNDQLLAALLTSLEYHHPDAMFDTTVVYDRTVLAQLSLDYEQRHSSSRAARYPEQVRDFLATLPLYLSGRPALAYPAVPQGWRGPVELTSLDDLCRRLGIASSPVLGKGGSQ